MRNIKPSKVAVLRHNLGWTQGVAAKAVGISLASLAKFEIGTARPSLRTVESMARAYGCRSSDIVEALPLERPKSMVKHRTPKAQQKPVDDDEDAKVLIAPSQTTRAPSWAIDPGTLMHAVRERIRHHKQQCDVVHEYAARALLACLRVGNIEQIADALIEHFVALAEDEEDDEDYEEGDDDDDDDE